MSEPRHRNEFEEQTIRNYAYQLWEKAGRPDNQEQKFWLDAEANLEASGQISVRPIALPFVIAFIASEPESNWPLTQILCPTGGPATNLNFFNITSSRLEQLPTRLDLDPRFVTHDYRSVLLQIAAVTTALDRIARLIEHTADYDNLDDAPFLLHDPSNHLPRLDPDYLRALLQPHTNRDKVGEIDRVLANRPYASAVTFDVEYIALGSNTTIAGRFRTTIARAFLAAGLMFGQPAGVGPVIVPPVVAAAAPAAAGAGGLTGIVVNAVGGAAGQIIAGRFEDYFFAPNPERDALREAVMRRYLADMFVKGPGGVKAVQRALRDLDFNPGEINGDPTEMTANAMSIFTLKKKVLNDWPYGPVAISALAQDWAKLAVP